MYIYEIETTLLKRLEWYNKLRDLSYKITNILVSSDINKRETDYNCISQMLLLIKSSSNLFYSHKELEDIANKFITEFQIFVDDNISSVLDSLWDNESINPLIKAYVLKAIELDKSKNGVLYKLDEFYNGDKSVENVISILNLLYSSSFYQHLPRDVWFAILKISFQFCVDIKNKLLDISNTIEVPEKEY